MNIRSSKGGLAINNEETATQPFGFRSMQFHMVSYEKDDEPDIYGASFAGKNTERSLHMQ